MDGREARRSEEWEGAKREREERESDKRELRRHFEKDEHPATSPLPSACCSASSTHCGTPPNT